MRARGFRFPSPFPGDKEDLAFARFAATAQTAYNPWPQLVPTTDVIAIRQPWSQPLLRTCYLPTTRSPDYFDGGPDALSFPLMLSLLHEGEHLRLAFTPAKELGRLCLGLADMLLFEELLPCPGDRWGEEHAVAWAKLQRLNDFLAETAERIEVAEELLVTSIVFTALEQMAVEDQDARRALNIAHWEAGWVTTQIEALWGAFENVYDRFEDFKMEYLRLALGFKKVAWLLVKEPPYPETFAPGPTLARLATFLQALEFGDLLRVEQWLTDDADDWEFDVPIGLLRAVDSLERCRRLVDFVESEEVMSCDQLCEWLARETTAITDAKLAEAAVQRLQGVLAEFAEEEHDRVTWALALRMASVLAQEYEHTGWLAETVLGESASKLLVDDDDIVEATIAAVVAHQNDNPPWLADPYASATIFYPREVNGHWRIAPKFISGSVDAEHRIGLLVRESLRQQLDARTGVRCPAYALLDCREHCFCAEASPEMREVYLRLAHWAKEEKRFGEGHWVDLPYPCGGH